MGCMFSISQGYWYQSCCKLVYKCHILVPSRNSSDSKGTIQTDYRLYNKYVIVVLENISFWLVYVWPYLTLTSE